MLSKKEPVLNDLGNSQPIQIAKNDNIKRLTVRKLCSGEKAKAMAGQPFANAEALKVGLMEPINNLSRSQK